MQQDLLKKYLSLFAAENLPGTENIVAANSIKEAITLIEAAKAGSGFISDFDDVISDTAERKRLQQQTVAKALQAAGLLNHIQTPPISA